MDTLAIRMTAAEMDILRERNDQRLRFDEHDDDKHASGELARAAAAYAIHASRAQSHDHTMPLIWPWDQGDWKPRTAREDLVRAGALIVAEIERRDRATPKQS